MRPRHIALALALAFLSAACASGPFDPGRLEDMKRRSEYTDLAAACLSHDEIWFFNEAGESLRIDALNVTPELLAAARARWSGDRTFTDTLARWLPKGEGRLVLLGLFNRRFKKDDFLKTGSYRARLVLPDGRGIDHDFAEEAQARFLADYFPAFNHWAKVFALHFPADPAAPASLEVRWPSGDRTLPLKRPAGAPAPAS
ncbi:MAG: hypothetical protein LBG06_08030 [Deltaproteobacteria bacterium]|jgi:hypothetical protein|nr:hypothetical protein [Deltaproteobacteria bacterium]